MISTPSSPELPRFRTGSRRSVGGSSWAAPSAVCSRPLTYAVWERTVTPVMTRPSSSSLRISQRVRSPKLEVAPNGSIRQEVTPPTAP